MGYRVFYSRVSSIDGSQNPERQLQHIDSFDYVLTDMCSGSIPLFERPKGSQLKRMIDEGTLDHLEIHSIDRLGRSTLDVLTVWEDLTQRGVTIVCRNPNIQNMDSQGKVDKFSELMMAILSTMSQFERNLIRERQLEGIRIRKQKKLYPGRQIGTKDSPQRLLGKPRSQQILKYMDKGSYTIREIASIVKCSPTTVSKVKQAREALSQASPSA